MNSGRCVTATTALLLMSSLAGLAQAAQPERELLDRYCVTCHNARNKGNAGGLALDSFDIAAPASRPDIAEKIVGKLRAGLMPPAGNRRPDSAQHSALIKYLERDLDRHAAVSPNPGRTEAFHRLNRAEYRNAVRDLLNLEMDVTAYLPSDDASFGFDNIAGVLKISQSRLEQYLGAARRISRAALGAPPPAPQSYEYRVAETAQQYDRAPDLPFGTRGGMSIRHEFPQDGEYDFRIELMCRLGGECDGSVGFPDEHHLLVLVDGEQITSFALEPRKEFRQPAERTWKVRVPIKAGPHTVGVTFEKLPSIREIDSAYERFQRPYVLNGVIGQPNHTIYQPFVDLLTIVGPFSPTGPGTTPSRGRVFACYPKTKAEEDPCAKAIIAKLARRAYRRPVGNADVAPMVAVYKAEASSNGFEAGVEAALQRLLVSPEFLYRVERDPAAAAPNTNYAITGLELASRLSFFLWSSIPDEKLLALAESGKLNDPVVLEQQVRRMLADRRADALIENFAGQWLGLRNLDPQVTRPDLPLFPNFDDTLRFAERRQAELFFGSVLREDRPVAALLTADYTFVNERLARHYGIPGIYGHEFRRVTVADENRRGLLGLGAVLTTTSRPNRTSPVLRGKWILDNIMGTPPPEPPADVPSLKEPENGQRAPLGTMRERMLAHRVNPVCSGCHAMIEPPGLALENFDAVGKWRDVDETQIRVDASGALPDGTKFDGLKSFKATLLRDPEIFATTVTKKLVTYALGRGLEPDAGHQPGVDDMPAVRKIVRDATPGGLKLSALVTGIVKSVPFQMRRTPGARQESSK
jgi:hypothetical protein